MKRAGEKHIRSNIEVVNPTMETVQACAITRAILDIIIYIASFD
jgi:hypothetical protein